ncbi:hypothetical protein [Paenibacillus larvae]|uniref:Uncharacterized protein n=1 Tax=Paenibacillus larvae subsp. larvae DSM 25430 TaxID=697284 RepID=V9W1J9_9BACL|nr:hypothetical protein ERIC2_c10431 [Paenibacillus larvae subsp. larvae DSM 25430]
MNKFKIDYWRKHLRITTNTVIPKLGTSVKMEMTGCTFPKQFDILKMRDISPLMILILMRTTYF